MSGEADPHTLLMAVRRRCGLVGIPLGSHPWLMSFLSVGADADGEIGNVRRQGNSFYTTAEMDGKGKSQSERARRRGRADGVSRHFIFRLTGSPFSLRPFFSGL